MNAGAGLGVTSPPEDPRLAKKKRAATIATAPTIPTWPRDGSKRGRRRRGVGFLLGAAASRTSVTRRGRAGRLALGRLRCRFFFVVFVVISVLR